MLCTRDMHLVFLKLKITKILQHSGRYDNVFIKFLNLGAFKMKIFRKDKKDYNNPLARYF